jgi:predicted unusual protein kinase regulating ubiquinone biosynthesis (AarF/ABC1/UbiB family)
MQRNATQALSSRPDVLPPEYIQELELLQVCDAALLV